uniref:YfjP family GTPase n=1 Tax=Nocardiopsis trehalosi TaxID=109329 RepID=UPI0008308AB5
PARPASHGRHAAPRRAAALPARRPGEPDEDDELAAWVGSLADAEETAMIAGRRTGPLPIVTEPGAADGAEDDPEDRAEDRADDRPVGADPAPVHAEDGGGTAERGAPAPAPAAPATDPAGPAAAADAADAPEAPGGDASRHEAEPDDAPVPSAVDTVDDEDDEYRPITREFWQPMPAISREQLIARLDGLATVVSLGRDDFDPEDISRARHLLDHAGARLRLSGEHTVVALAGGTGSGKSSLFNALCGLDFSRVGITRPTTSAAHACVWGNEGAEGLLGWLGVPRRNRHSRTSELDKGGSELSGLILLDLPDHDSVRAVHTAEADRMIGSADLLVWVLDPQKYADAAVHHRYLAEMSGYGAVTVAVLNQVDRVEPEELEELLTDLRRLLETESGVQPRVLTTSALTGRGIRDLRELLVETVTERRAMIDRLVADLGRVVGSFERYHGDDGAEIAVPADVRQRLVADFLEAGGASAIADSAETAYEQRGSRRVGWPLARWAGRLRRDPLRAARLDFLRGGGAGVTGPVEAQRAEVEKAAAEVAEHVSGSLPAPWPRRVRAAARAGTADLPTDIGAAIAGTVPDPDDTPGWWRTVGAVQHVLVVLGVAGLAWFGTILTSWLMGGATGVAALDDPVFLALAGAVVAAAPVVGWLTGVGCRNLVSVAAAQRRERVELDSAEKVRALAEERVLAPVERELRRYHEYSEALAAAKG